jgi:hypothetical protein
MKENNIDNYFKDRLDSHVESPSDDVWGRIDAQLSGAKGDNAGGAQWRTMALLSLGLLFILSGLFFWRMDRLDKENEALELALSEERFASEQTSDGLGEDGSIQDQVKTDSYSELIAESTIGQNVDQQVKEEIEAQSEVQSTRKDGGYSAPYDPAVQDKTAPAARSTTAKQSASDASSNTNDEQDKKESAGSMASTAVIGQISGSNSADEIGLKATESSLSIETEAFVVDATPKTAQEDEKDVLESEVILEQDHSTTNFSELKELGILEPLKYIPIELGSLWSHKSHGGIDSTYTPSPRILFMTDSKWSIGLATYQNRTFRRIRTQNPESNQLRSSLDKSEQASNSIGMRGYLGYRLGKRMSLTLGLDYSQWRQDGSYRVNYELPIPGDISINPLPSTFESELVTSTSTSDVTIQATFDPSVETWVGFGTSSSVQVDRKEEITFLSVPLSLRYQTYLRRLGLQGGVGLAYDIILNSSSETTISGEFESSSIANTALQKEGYVSAHAEIGLFYRFSERNKIHIGPRFKSWLIPLYENEGLRTYPYSNAIEVGIEIGL